MGCAFLLRTHGTARVFVCLRFALIVEENWEVLINVIYMLPQMLDLSEG